MFCIASPATQLSRRSILLDRRGLSVLLLTMLRCPRSCHPSIFAIAATAASSSEAVAGCATCTSGQTCEPGESGDHCVIFYDDEGEQWCNWRGKCEINPTMLTPDQLSPAGTYLAVDAVEDSERQVTVTGCSNLIVDHLSTIEPLEMAITL